jgi:hypothetical protein
VRRKLSQRDYMRELVGRFDPIRERGEVVRKSNSHGINAEQYARALWNDAVKKGRIGSLRPWTRSLSMYMYSDIMYMR